MEYTAINLILAKVLINDLERRNTMSEKKVIYTDEADQKKQFGVIGSCLVGTVTLATSLFQYLDQQLAMGILEYYGYSLQNVSRSPYDIFSIIFESTKCIFFILVVHLVFYALFQLAKIIELDKLASEIQLVYTAVLTFCIHNFQWVQAIMSKSKSRFQNKNDNAICDKGTNKTEHNKLKSKHKKCLIVFLKVTYVCLVIILGWISLQLTKNAVQICITRSLRLYGYTEGTSFYIPERLKEISMFALAMPKTNLKELSEYLPYLIFYVPAGIYFLVKKLVQMKKQVYRAMILGLLICLIPISYSLSISDIASTVYKIGQDRVEHNIYHDVIYLDEVMYTVAYENDTHLYVTRCEYDEASEGLIIYAHERMCVDKEGVLIKKFTAYDGTKSNFTDFTEPLDKTE